MKVNQVSVYNLSNQEVLTEIQQYRVENTFFVNVVNTLSLEFTESQIKEYIQNKYQMFAVEIELYIPNSVRGVRVKVNYDK